MFIQSDSQDAILPADHVSAGTWSGKTAGLGAVDWLMLAAMPIFAAMALLTAFGDGPDMICSAMDASPLSGMAPMYALMSVFHAPPWFRLIAKARLKSSRIAPDRTHQAPDGLWLS
jgi:hypothetical protein